MLTKDPRLDPAPESHYERLMAFAKDWAYGFINGEFPESLKEGDTDPFSLQFYVFPRDPNHRQEKYTSDDPNLSKEHRQYLIYTEYLMGKWEEHNYPELNRLVPLGYAEEVKGDKYRITLKSIALLEIPETASIFISYSTQHSSAFALLIRQMLINAGLGVPYLDLELQGGDDWHGDLLRRIDEREDFIVLLAPGSLDREFVCKELRYAIKQKREIIPILHGWSENDELSSSVDPDLVPIIQAKHCIHVERENAASYDSAITALLNRYGVAR